MILIQLFQKIGVGGGILFLFFTHQDRHCIERVSGAYFREESLPAHAHARVIATKSRGGL